MKAVDKVQYPFVRCLPANVARPQTESLGMRNIQFIISGFYCPIFYNRYWAMLPIAKSMFFPNL